MLSIKDFFGPDRDMCCYYATLKTGQEESAPTIRREQISTENKNEILALAKEIYSADRYKEFEVCLELYLDQPTEGKMMVKPESFVRRDDYERVQAFAIVVWGIYENCFAVAWEGANPAATSSKKSLVEGIKGFGQETHNDVAIVYREGEDRDFFKYGFESAENGIPCVFAKKDKTKMLFYTKKL